METQQAYQLVSEDYVLPNDSATDLFPVANSQGNTPLQPFIYAHVLLYMTVGEGEETVTFDIQISSDNVTWYDTTIHDLTAAVNKWVQAANLAIAANVQDAIIGLSNPAHYVRVTANNSGATAATIHDMWLITES